MTDYTKDNIFVNKKDIRRLFNEFKRINKYKGVYTNNNGKYLIQIQHKKLIHVKEFNCPLELSI